MASVEGTRIEALSKVGFGEGCPLPSRLGCLGERRELPSGVLAESRPEMHFGHIFGS